MIAPANRALVTNSIRVLLTVTVTGASPVASIAARYASNSSRARDRPSKCASNGMRTQACEELRFAYGFPQRGQNQSGRIIGSSVSSVATVGI